MALYPPGLGSLGESQSDNKEAQHEQRESMKRMLTHLR
jgi:hypothetical protein